MASFWSEKLFVKKVVKCKISEIAGLSKQQYLEFFRDYLLLYQQTWF